MTKVQDDLSCLWLARDKDGWAYLYGNKPSKNTTSWWSEEGCMDVFDKQIPKDCNPKWEDTEPVKVKLTLIE